MVDATEGVLFGIQNLQEGNRYIKKGQKIFPCPSYVNIDNIFELAPDEDVVTMLAKPMAKIILEYDFSIVTKPSFGIRPAEAEEMQLISKYTSVPAPKVYHTNSSSEDKSFIVTSLIEGPRPIGREMGYDG